MLCNSKLFALVCLAFVTTKEVLAEPVAPYLGEDDEAFQLGPNVSFSDPYTLNERSGGPFMTRIKSLASSPYFTAEITLGGQHFTVLVDTGSSATLIATYDFQYTTGHFEFRTMNNQEDHHDNHFHQIPNATCYLGYETGDFYTGAWGNASVTFAGQILPNATSPLS